jgi:hypothetical protein
MLEREKVSTHAAEGGARGCFVANRHTPHLRTDLLAFVIGFRLIEF